MAGSDGWGMERKGGAGSGTAATAGTNGSRSPDGEQDSPPLPVPAARPRRPAPTQTLNRNSRMSPSFTTYSFPSDRISPCSRAAFTLPTFSKSA